jgi:hypothetical protein
MARRTCGLRGKRWAVIMYCGKEVGRNNVRRKIGGQERTVVKERDVMRMMEAKETADND